jgi:hypothetical protein
VVGISAPVWGSVVVVGLEYTSIILPKITSNQGGKGNKREGKGTHKSIS